MTDLTTRIEMLRDSMLDRIGLFQGEDTWKIWILVHQVLPWFRGGMMRSVTWLEYCNILENFILLLWLRYTRPIKSIFLGKGHEPGSCRVHVSRQNKNGSDRNDWTLHSSCLGKNIWGRLWFQEGYPSSMGLWGRKYTTTVTFMKFTGFRDIPIARPWNFLNCNNHYQ